MSDEVNSLYYKAQNYEKLNNKDQEQESEENGGNQRQFSIKESLILGPQQRS